MDQIKQVKESLNNNGRKGIALDIDNTLCLTNYHWIDQMRIKFGNPENYDRDEMLNKYQHIQHIPYYQTPEAQAMMEEMIHSNEFQETIPLIEDADQYVQELNKIIPIAAYITARPDSILEGTLNWMRKHNFPEAPIILRPLSVPFFDGEKWKAEVLHELYPEVVGIVDDNLILPKVVPEDYRGEIFLYGRTENPSNYKRVHVCENWPVVLDQVKLWKAKI